MRGRCVYDSNTHFTCHMFNALKNARVVVRILMMFASTRTGGRGWGRVNDRCCTCYAIAFLGTDCLESGTDLLCENIAKRTWPPKKVTFSEGSKTWIWPLSTVNNCISNTVIQFPHFQTTSHLKNTIKPHAFAYFSDASHDRIDHHCSCGFQSAGMSIVAVCSVPSSGPALAP